MNPIDKLKKADYTVVFKNYDIDAADVAIRPIGVYGIFSDDGQVWSVGVLAGIEYTCDGIMYRRKELGLQYKHFRRIRYREGFEALMKCQNHTIDCHVVGERTDNWLVFTEDRHPVIVKKSDVVFKEDIKFGGEA